MSSSSPERPPWFESLEIEFIQHSPQENDLLRCPRIDELSLPQVFLAAPVRKLGPYLVLYELLYRGSQLL